VFYRGISLRALREQKKIKLRRIADETRIAIRYLDAIEEERFDRFPGEFYFKSFAGEYARSLGLDPGKVLPDLQEAYNEWARSRLREKERLYARTRIQPTSETGFLSRLTGRIKRIHEV